MMRQMLHSFTDGQPSLVEVPSPAAARGGLLVRTTRSLISAGTERMLVDFGRAGWLAKARHHPDKVRQVLEKIGTDGLLPTLEAVRSKLKQPLPLGYCNVGRVLEAGADVSGFIAGDRVVSNGAHAEVVAVQRNLCALVPDNVSDDEAAFAVLGAIALQGVRLAMPTLGERFVVTGLGLIGLITVQLLRANGCRVLGIDPDPSKAELAKRFGADVVALDSGEDGLAVAEAFSNREGVDGVLITASTRSNEPVTQGARMCRPRGRIVLVGVAGLEFNRADFYQKELQFQVSCSYGPGRYDPTYEDQGRDYPIGYVRWTEQRNFTAVLDLMASGRLDVRPLITHRFAFEDAPAAYDLLASGTVQSLGILLEYSTHLTERSLSRTVTWIQSASLERQALPQAVAFIGAGNYLSRVLIPAFASNGVRLIGIASSGGVSAAHVGRKFGFLRATTDPDALIDSPEVGIVVIGTRHDSHARLLIRALQAGKDVFIEKPLALTMEEIDRIVAVWDACGKDGKRPHVMVGFNRRFAPHIKKMKALLGGVREPKSYIVTVNAGAIPQNHWTQDPKAGGGRIIGEGCHFVDLLRFLTGSPIEHARVQTLGRGHRISDDNVAITLSFADGSWGTIHYVANGHRSFPKERLEVFCAGRVLQLDNFRRLRGFGWPGFTKMNLWKQDKGQNACVSEFLRSVEDGSVTPIRFEDLIEVARVTVALGEAARS